MNEQEKEQPKKAIYKRWWFWVIAVVLLIFAIAGLGDGNTNSNTTQTPTEQKEVQAQAAPFDVPALLGKNMDEVKQALADAKVYGSEPTAAQLQTGLIKEWDMEFERGKQRLSVTYSLADRSVIDFFISTTDPSGATKDTKALLAAGNLKENDGRYKTEFVKSLTDKSVYTGVLITPVK